MGDGRTDLFRNMWTRTTTNDTKGASLEEQAKHTDWEYPDTEVREEQHLDLDYMPDQKMHRTMSFIKSTIRIAGCILGVTHKVELGFILLLVAELVGIVEELV